MLVNRHILKIAALGLVALIFFSAGLVGQAIMVVVALALVAGWKRARGEEAGAVLGVLGWLGNALATFGALLATTRWGRSAGGTVAVLMLADASWGSDGIGLPLVGWPLGVIVALIVGGREWRRRRPYVARVEDAVRSAVAGFTRTHLPQVSFSEGPMGRWLGRWLPGGAFAFHVPPEVRGSDVVGIEQHLRERLPAKHGTSWKFEWDLRVGVCRASVVPDLPTSVWHPAADGSRGTPLNPIGNPYRIPLGVAMGGEEVCWKAEGQTSNILAVGAIGGGKSNAMQTILEHMLLFRDYYSVMMIDPKYLEFADYLEYPRDVIQQVALDLETAHYVMTDAREEIERRKPILARAGVKKIEDYNAIMARREEPPMKHLAVFIDEVAELLEKSDSKDETAKEEDAMRGDIAVKYRSIAQLGRAFGLNLVSATQRNDAKIIDGRSRANTQARIATGRLTPEGSRMAVESELACALPGIPGRALFWEAGQVKEIQVYRTEAEHIQDMAGVTR